MEFGQRMMAFDADRLWVPTAQIPKSGGCECSTRNRRLGQFSYPEGGGRAALTG
jgi:hypothetical protein